MKSNKLYQFITALAAAGQSTIAHKTVFFKKNKEQINYVLYNLVKENQLFIMKDNSPYDLISHHISFYEDQDDKIAYLSQYHYTAYFNDQSNNEYQLHVYFNEFDQALTLHFSKYIESQFIKQKISQFDASNFIQFATNETLVFVKKLRSLYDSEIKKTESNYHQLCTELEALSVNFEKNHILYKEKINLIIRVLEQLSVYYPDNYYTKLLYLFKRIQESKLVPKENSKLDSIEFQTVSTKTRDDKKLNFFNLSHKEVNLPEIELSVTTLLAQAIKAHDEYCSLSKDVLDEKKLKTLMKYIITIQNLIMASMDDRYKLNEKDVCTVQTLCVQSTQAAENLLARLLITNSFNLANLLKSFLKPLSTRLMKLALHTGNAQLLNYILENDIMPINTFIVADNLTPVLFCFLRHTDTKPLVACMTVLVKHKANLFIKTPDGLPLAHPITLLVQHPMRKAFLDNMSLTLSNPVFYKQLIAELKKYKNKEMSFALDAYQNALLLLEKIGSANLDKQRIGNEVNKRELENYFGSLTVEILKNDPEFRVKQVVYEEALRSFMSRLSKREAQQIIRTNSQFINNLTRILKEIDVRSCDIKEQVLIMLSEQTEVLNLNCELLDIQKHFEQPTYKSRGFGLCKNNKQLVNRQQEIIMELKLLNEQYVRLDDEETTEEAIKLIKLFNLLDTLPEELQIEVINDQEILNSMRAMKNSGFFSNKTDLLESKTEEETKECLIEIEAIINSF